MTVEADIAALVAGQSLPINVMGRPGLPSLAALTRLGVRRLSTGSAIAQQTCAGIRRAGEIFLREGSTDALHADSLGFGEVNALFAAVPTPA